jgi:putative hydrolase of HD superfamily
MSPSAVTDSLTDATGNEIQPASPDPSIVVTPKVTGEWTVDKVLETISTGRPTEGSTSPVPYFHMLERLKTTKREGWRRFGIAR